MTRKRQPNQTHNNVIPFPESPERTVEIPVTQKESTYHMTRRGRAIMWIAGLAVAAGGLNIAHNAADEKSASDSLDMMKNTRANVLHTDFDKLDDKVLRFESGTKLTLTPNKQRAGNPIDGDPTSNVGMEIPMGYFMIGRVPEVSPEYPDKMAFALLSAPGFSSQKDRENATYFVNDSDAKELPYQGDPKVGFRQNRYDLIASPLATDPNAPLATAVLFKNDTDPKVVQEFVEYGTLPANE